LLEGLWAYLVLDRHTKAYNTIDTVQIRRVTIRDRAEFGVNEVISDLHYVTALISLEMCVVGVT
jgi:hypothetical protein